MKREIGGPALAAIVVVVVIALAVLGYRQFGGSKQGERPALSPQLSRMYPARPEAAAQTSKP